MHTLQLPLQSIRDQQELATRGKFGKQACCNSKPFESLLAADLRHELHARAIYFRHRSGAKTIYRMC